MANANGPRSAHVSVSRFGPGISAIDFKIGLKLVGNVTLVEVVDEVVIGTGMNVGLEFKKKLDDKIVKMKNLKLMIDLFDRLVMKMKSS